MQTDLIWLYIKETRLLKNRYILESAVEGREIDQKEAGEEQYMKQLQKSTKAGEK